jgi:4-hydroxy-tetrahydrodipicolinate synthase
MTGALRGVIPVLQTPFTTDDRVDDACLEREVQFCLKAGVHGVVVPIMASEFWVLSHEERKHISELVVSAASKKIPVIVGVAAPSAKEAEELSTHAAFIGASAVIALPPYVRKPKMAGLHDYYERIAKASGLPVILQNAAPPLGLGLEAEPILALMQKTPQIKYVKEETLPCGPRMRRLQNICRGHMVGVYGGFGGIYMIPELARGAIGFMTATAVADVQSQIFDLYNDGKEGEARRIYNSLLPYLALEGSCEMALTKELLVRRGVFTNSIMRDPDARGVDAEDLVELERILVDLQTVFTVKR